MHKSNKTMPSDLENESEYDCEESSNNMSCTARSNRRCWNLGSFNISKEENVPSQQISPLRSIY